MEACAEQEDKRHTEQMAAFNKLTETVQGMREEQEKTNQMLREQELERREANIRRRERELGIEN